MHASIESQQLVAVFTNKLHRTECSFTEILVKHEFMIFQTETDYAKVRKIWEFFLLQKDVNSTIITVVGPLACSCLREDDEDNAFFAELPFK